MKILRILLIAIILSASFLTMPFPVSPVAYSQNQEMVYVGSRHSDKYHRPSCSAARRIKSSNLATFDSKDEAQQAGYVPCKICRP